MPFIKLQFRPGIVRDTTNYANEGGWFECDKVRFFSGFPQKIGGWAEVTSQRAAGVCRQMWNWVTSYTDNFLAVGTNVKVYIEVGGIYYNITPLRTTLTTTATDDCIDTTDDSTVVNINVVGHGCRTGDFVTISGATTVGGIPAAELNAEHEVTRVDDDNFTFTVATEATSTVTGGGGSSIDIACQISPGFAIQTAGYGWGTGVWQGSETTNTFGWNQEASEPVYLPQRDWWFDNFDNDLVMNIRADTVSGTSEATGGAIYYWERGTNVSPTSSLATPAKLLSGLTLNGVSPTNVPEVVGQILVSQNDKHLLAFGATPYYTVGSAPPFDPLLIRWASQDQPNEWGPTTTNSAGFLRVSRGSKIVRAIPTRQEIVVLTDSHIYSLQFLGTTDVFGLQELSDNISVISPRAVVSVNNVVYWMGTERFYRYDGRAQTLPCTIKDYVFSDINFNQADQIFSGTNEGFNEIWWFYPSATSTYNDRYVVYNHLENVWYYGTISRTAWLDTTLRTVPVAFEYIPGETEIIYSDIPNAILRASVGREPENTLFVTTTLAGGRPLADITGNGLVTSADFLAYQQWINNSPSLTAGERDWIENYLNPYMLANPDTYGQYLILRDVSVLYNHETGLDDGTLPMEAFIQSSDFDIGEGEQFMLTRRIIPDVAFHGSTAESPEVDIAIRPRNWPGSNFQGDPSDTQRVIQSSVGVYTNQIFIRARARQMAFKIASDQLGVQWQLGMPRLDARPDGRQ